jgi:hypothetical protein
VGQRDRQLKSVVLRTVSPALANFSGASSKDLAAVAKKDCVELGYGQAYNMIAEDKESDLDAGLAHYCLLDSFMQQLQQQDPGGLYKVWTYVVRTGDGREERRFDRLVMVFSSARNIWKNIAKGVAVLDGTFLTNATSGTLLTWSAVDGNNSSIDLAYAIVRGEDSDTWPWFIENVTDWLGRTVDVLVSDADKGLTCLAVKQYVEDNVMMTARCLWHIKEKNAQSKCSTTLQASTKNDIWWLGKATSRDGFDSRLSSIRAVDEKLAEWLDSIKESFAAYHFLENGFPRYVGLLYPSCS